MDFSSIVQRNEPADDPERKLPPVVPPSSSWSCANCKSIVSSQRCPTCHGLQVDVQIRVRLDEQSNREAWLQRLSPAIFARSSPFQNNSQETEFRPLDPVACVLASAPSPVVEDKKVVALQDIEERLRKRPHVAETEPKKKLLSAV